MEEKSAEEPRSRRRLRFEFRVTPYEDRFIREAAAALDMSITDYVLKRAVYSEEEIDGVRTCEHTAVPVCADEDAHGCGGVALSGCGSADLSGDEDTHLCGCGAALAGHECLRLCTGERLSACTDAQADAKPALVANQELLRDILAELKAQGRNINQIAKAASKIALDTRSRSSIDLGKALKSMTRDLTPKMVQCVLAVSTAIGTAYPDRR